jgi:endonuclease/exonuclease/phosphatase family metal-dependent hydrolase
VLIATWNLNHSVGKTRFRAEAVNAVAALQADVVVLTEYYPGYYPRDYESVFRADLSKAGWHLLASEIVGEIANRVLIASRFPLEPFPLRLPDFDRQFSPQILCVTIPAAGVRVLGIRIPAYIGEDKPYISRSWDWLESTLSGLHDMPTIVAGDFNVNVDSPRAKGGDHFRRILANGWRRSAPKGQGSYFGPNGRRAEIDHILCNSGLSFTDARYVTEAGRFQLAGTAGALSDHAVVLAWAQRK